MSDDIARLALFTLLPVVLAGAIVIFDRTASGPVRRAEAFLVPLFLIGIGGAGVTDFIGHVLIADPVARSLGWDTGSPFQLMTGFAGLAIGLLGAVAAERRDGFREATVVAAAIFAAGKAVAFVLDAIGRGSLLSANVLQGLAALIVPALLVWFLLLARRGEEAEQQTILLRGWMIPVRRGSVFAVGVAATAFSLGYSTGQMLLLAAAGFVVAAVAFWWFVSRAASHKVRAEA